MIERLPGLSFTPQNIYGIGRNYAEHAAELGNKVPESPVIFQKPNSALCTSGAQVKFPAGIGRVDYETEIVVAIGKPLEMATEAAAIDAIAGFSVGIDFTARDRQTELKKKGLPWFFAKGFRNAAAVGTFVTADLPLTLSLTVNGERRQQGSSEQMVFAIPHLLALLSHEITLRPGDLVFTGTPAGVGPVNSGDKLVAELGKGLVRLELAIM